MKLSAFLKNPQENVIIMVDSFFPEPALGISKICFQYSGDETGNLDNLLLDTLLVYSLAGIDVSIQKPSFLTDEHFLRLSETLEQIHVSVVA